jgi:putative restriction endonuclease
MFTEQATWEELVAKMRRGHNAGEPTTHKPLLTLMLLARAQQGAPNLLYFKDLDGPLKEAIERFSPPSERGSPELPFWHLQSEHFWVVDGADALPRPLGKNRPLRTTLLEHNAAGHVDPKLWAQLLADPALIDRLAQQILDDYWPGGEEHDAILAAVDLRRPAQVRAEPGEESAAATGLVQSFAATKKQP